MRASLLWCGVLCCVLAACQSTPRQSEPEQAPQQSTQTRPGGYYEDDGPEENPPPGLEATPDAAPQPEPLHRFANAPYVVFGETYIPAAASAGQRSRGLATWYGKKFHGRRTASGEIYDMYKMTAAHRTLPIPSYARVTNLRNKRSVVVRINDRGPFRKNRIIDLSYTAALKLGLVRQGRAMVEVEPIVFDRNKPQQQGLLPPQQQPDAAPLRASLVTPQPSVAPPPLAQSATSSPAPIAAPTSAAIAWTAGQNAGGHFVQLAAFATHANALNYMQRIQQELDWLRELLQVNVRNGVHRVRAGPYADAVQARTVAGRLRDKLGLTAVVTPF